MGSGALKAFLIALAATALVGCTGRPIVNIKGSPTEVGGKPPPIATVERAILRAGELNDWQMQTVRPGLIVGKRTWSTHTAVVEVTYTAAAYDITYKDSANLGYDGTNIHRNYNYYVQELDKAIRAQLLNL
jgi:hypothetical protein